MQKRRAYSYIRFSDPTQATGNSLERQLERAQRWADDEGWELDTSSYRDLGCSGYRPGKQLALAAFLKEIGRSVHPGSVLIVERLDRLTRRETDDAYQLFRKIILAGVDIGVESRRKVYTKKSLNDPFELMSVIMEFALANEESEKKSDRTKDNWDKKRQRAVKGKPDASRRCPAWIDVVDGHFVLNKPKAAIIRKIFQWCIDGLGSPQIRKKLNEQGITSIAVGTKANCKTTWNLRYVEAILTNPQTFGQNQLYRMTDDGRIPEGSPIDDYYPAAISEDIFFAAQAARKSRKTQRGPRGESVANLFQGLIWDAHSGERMRMANSSRQDKKRGIMRRLASYHVHNYEHASWSYHEFEKYFLKAFKEINAEKLKTNRPTIDPLPGLYEALASTESQIEKIQNKIVEGGSVDALVGTLRKLDGRKMEIESSIESVKESRQTAKATEAENVLTTLKLLESAEGEELEAVRDKVRSLIRLIVDEIWVCIISDEGNRLKRLLKCQIFFKDGGFRDDGYREFTLYSEGGKLKLFINFPRSPNKTFGKHASLVAKQLGLSKVDLRKFRYLPA